MGERVQILAKCCKGSRSLKHLEGTSSRREAQLARLAGDSGWLATVAGACRPFVGKHAERLASELAAFWDAGMTVEAYDAAVHEKSAAAASDSEARSNPHKNDPVPPGASGSNEAADSARSLVNGGGSPSKKRPRQVSPPPTQVLLYEDSEAVYEAWQ